MVLLKITYTAQGYYTQFPWRRLGLILLQGNYFFKCFIIMRGSILVDSDRSTLINRDRPVLSCIGGQKYTQAGDSIFVHFAWPFCFIRLFYYIIIIQIIRKTIIVYIDDDVSSRMDRLYFKIGEMLLGSVHYLTESNVHRTRGDGCSHLRAIVIFFVRPGGQQVGNRKLIYF